MRETRVAGTRFDLVFTALFGLALAAFFSDLWAHSHGRVETFFTPWHLALYSSVGLITVALGAVWARNVRAGRSRTRALPSGYGLSFVGAILFLVGGLLDMLWHLAFGIEVNVSALFSPTHILLFTAGVLMMSGPMRAAWRRGDDARTTWIVRLPAVLSAAFVLSILTAMTNFINPIVDTFAEMPPGDSGVMTELYQMNGDGSRETRLLAAEDEHYYAITPSPDGSKIAFGHGREAWGIATANADGSDVRTLVAPSADIAYPSSWSPDGKYLAISQHATDDTFRVVVIDVRSGTRTMPAGDANAGRPMFSPDGARIAFYQIVDGRPQIFVMNADGTSRTQLTSSGESWGAMWSPDGSRIAFNSSRTGRQQIYVMAADGSGQVQITHAEGSAYSPTWSPDGQRIAYVAQTDGGRDIDVVNADGTNERDLTRTRALDENTPYWSRSGVLLYEAIGHTPADLVPDIRERLGLAAILAESALLAGVVLLLLRRGGLPLGAITLIVGVNTALMSVLNDEYRLIPGALMAGVLGDAVVWRVGRSRRFAPYASRVVGFVVPASFCAAYLMTLALGRGIGWSVHLWVGSVFLAGAVGVLFAVLFDETPAARLAAC